MIRRLILQPITKTLMMRGKPDQIIFQKKTFSKIQKKIYKNVFSNLFYIFTNAVYFKFANNRIYIHRYIYLLL